MLAVRFFLFYNSWDGRDSAESTKSTHDPAFLKCAGLHIPAHESGLSAYLT